MARRTAGYGLLVVALTAGLAGCASGPVNGNVTMRGSTLGPLSMTWTSGLFGESGKIAAVMPDGERFSGTYQVLKAGTSRTTLGPDWTNEPPSQAQEDLDDSLWGAARDPAFVQRYENSAVATLRGDRGTTMLCRFFLNAAGAGMGGGGNGKCQTTKGTKITAVF